MSQQLTSPDDSVDPRLANWSERAGPHTNYSAPADIDVVRTIAVEYIQMPELALTVIQGARLWSLNLETCRHVLDQLTGDGFLIKGSDHRYRRVRRQAPGD